MKSKSKQKSRVRGKKQRRTQKNKHKLSSIDFFKNNSTDNKHDQSMSSHFGKYLQYTKNEDKHFASYGNTEEFKDLVKVNPTVLVISYLYHKEFNKSFFVELFKEDNAPFYACLYHYLYLKDLVKESDEQLPIIELLIKHGFHTIYDILLENNDSFYLVAFIAHISSFELIENSNDFLISLKTNKLYNKLRNRKFLEPLQKMKLYTRTKKWQIK